MAEVVAIRQGLAVEPPAGTVNADVVKELQELLDKASSGDITGIAFVSLHPGDLTVHHSVGRITRGVIGAMTLLQYSLARSDLENDDLG
jgi:hypothetical protein